MPELLTSRRGFLTGLGAVLVAAPAIVRAGSLMPVKAMIETSELQPYQKAMIEHMVRTADEGRLAILGENLVGWPLVYSDGRTYWLTQDRGLIEVA
jgi:hypothetical protein